MRFLVGLLIFILPLITLGEPPKRVVVLSPALTEIMFTVGKGDIIVGTTEFSDYPRAAKSIKRVGSYAAPSLEKIIALRPDSVFLAAEGIDSVSEGLKNAGIHTEVFKMNTLNDFYAVLKQLGKIFDIDETVERISTDWAKSWNKLDKAQSTHKVLIQVDHDPVFIAGGETFLSELVEKCGSSNILADLIGYKQPTLERLVQSKADIILVIVSPKKLSAKNEIKKFWNRQPAKVKPQILFFDPDLISRLSPRLPAATLALCNELKTFSKQ